MTLLAREKRNGCLEQQNHCRKKLSVEIVNNDVEKSRSLAKLGKFKNLPRTSFSKQHEAFSHLTLYNCAASEFTDKNVHKHRLSGLLGNAVWVDRAASVFILIAILQMKCALWMARLMLWSRPSDSHSIISYCLSEI